MRWWFQRRAGKRDQVSDVDVIAAAKRRAELADLQLGIRERTLKIDAIERVAQSEPDAVTALEVISVATHRGRLPPTVFSRRKPEQSPLETLAMAMLQKRLEEDPTDALDRIIERRERLEDYADRVTGRPGRDDAGTGNTLVDVARAVANSPLGEAVGQVLGAGVQQRMAEAAAAAHTTTGLAPVPVPPASALNSPAPPVAAPPLQAPGPQPGPPPTSFRVGMALRVLRSLDAAGRARWILAQADQHPELGELVEPFLAAEPDAVPLILEAFMSEAATAADPAALEWVPLVAAFRDNLEWTLETHREMRALTIQDDEDLDDPPDDQVAGG